MAHNIIVSSDGTGQRGGVFFDEKRFDIYKLYRATRLKPYRPEALRNHQDVAHFYQGLGAGPPSADSGSERCCFSPATPISPTRASSASTGGRLPRSPNTTRR